MTHCLLCNSTDTKEIGDIASKRIIKKYLDTYKIDVAHLFNDGKIKLIKCNSCELRFYFPLVTGDEAFYAALQKTDYYYREDKEEYNFAAKLITEPANVLDVGCGKGVFKKFIPNSNFTGLEFSNEAIKTGTENGCHILNQSIEEHAALNPAKYDFVTAFQVLEHVSNVGQFVDACAKCVKPGGKLIIAVPSEESYLYCSTNSILNMPPHHVSRWTDKALFNIAGLIDFKFVEIFHDSLDKLHVKSYFTALIERSLPFKGNSSNIFIDDSLMYSGRIKIASMLANRMSKACSHAAWHGKGQNVTAVYQKPY
jgi:2-polyprenyl-3-methyl-5-hydroxy-6-metoxy-1,4-benzoquinol methylase